jgi:hypothetical protein
MSRIKAISSALVLVAVAAIALLSPPKAHAYRPVCYYAGQAYSVGACLNHMLCTSDGTWQNGGC